MVRMKVLISGASMAGLSAAYWFARAGAEVTVLEQHHEARRGGAPIDVRGAALETAERMGILDEVRRQRVGQAASGPVLRADGNVVATIDLSWFSNETADDVEISRDRLLNLLMGAVGDRAEFRFGTSLQSLRQDAEGAWVRSTGGGDERFDLVVGADGLHSTTRRLAFGPEADYVVHQGYYVALIGLDPDQSWQQAMYSVPGRTVSVRDVGDGPFAFLLARHDVIDYDYRDLAGQRKLVNSLFDLGEVWELPRIRAAFADEASPGFYFDSVSQTRMSSWSRDRVVLVGDAAHCASLLSGMGTALAMTAAEYLVEEVMRSPEDLAGAFARYESRQRPLVDKAQGSVAEHGFMLVPATEEELDRRNGILRDLAASHAHGV